MANKNGVKYFSIFVMMNKVTKIFWVVIFLCINTFIYAQQKEDFFDAIRNNNLTVFNTNLKQNKIVVNKKNTKGFTPLILACYYNRIKMAKILLENQADINAISNMGTALMAATYKGDLEMVNLLLKNNANPNITDDKGTSALHLACIFNKTEIAKTLLEHHAQKNLLDAQHKTALDYAVLNNNIELIKLFEHE